MNYLYGIITLILISLLLMVACKPTALLTPDNSNKICYGSYGGFAGLYTEYVLLPDGELYRKDGINAEYQKLSPIDREVSAQMFSILEDMRREYQPLDEPGNMSYFVRYESEDSDTLAWTWGGSNSRPDSRLRILHQNLNRLSKPKNPVM